MKTITIKQKATGFIAYMDEQPWGPPSWRLADLKHPALHAIRAGRGKVVFLRPTGVETTSAVTLYDCRPERGYRAGLWASS
ncbi:hypothetical protein ACXXNA_19030 [Bordetella bronchiseptica]|uniref:hypothetical protein n=1 Tax=Bordetella bronchiseptica TaxID=518 RepID=UPI003F74220B